MYDKNFVKINVGDLIYFHCGSWHFEAKVYKVDDNKIYHFQTTEGNGEGIRRENNRIECERYIIVLNGI
jgi:hypothetical protein